MSKLRDYINKVENFKRENPELNDIEIVRYIYLDLGKMFSFDEKAYFGSSEEKKDIWNNSMYSDVEELMEKECAANGIKFCRIWRSGIIISER